MNPQELRSATLQLPMRHRLLLILDLVRSLLWPRQRASDPILETDRPQILDPVESKLLLAINQALPSDLQNRYEWLIDKRDTESLSTDEYAELIALGNHIEALEAERLQRLIELSQLRRVSLEKLMCDLGLSKVTAAV